MGNFIFLLHYLLFIGSLKKYTFFSHIKHKMKTLHHIFKTLQNHTTQAVSERWFTCGSQFLNVGWQAETMADKILCCGSSSQFPWTHPNPRHPLYCYFPLIKLIVIDGSVGPSLSHALVDIVCWKCPLRNRPSLHFTPLQ